MVKRLALALLALACARPAVAAEIMLYETGPGVASGYVRFLDAAAGPITIATKGASLTLGGDDGVLISRFQAVPAGSAQRAQVTAPGGSAPVEVTLTADEFVTIAVLGDGKSLLIRDTPQEFNALKADIAFLNADPGCASGTLRAGAKKVTVFDKMAPGAIARRLVNPAAAVVEVACDGQTVDSLDLGTLEAGGRYSIVVLPDGKGGRRLIGGRDERASYN